MTASTVQNGQTSYTSIRLPADSLHPVPPPLPSAAATPSDDDYSSFTISSTGPVELLLIDPSGRRTGQAGRDAPDLREIPRSGSDCDYISDDSDSGGGDTPHVLELMVSQPDSGRYILEVHGTGDGTFDLGLNFISSAGRASDIRGLGGTAKSGMVLRFAFTFLRSAPTPEVLDTLPGTAPR